MLKHIFFMAAAACATLAFAASAQAAYLSLGTSNSSNATTTLSGNPAGAELQVRNTNGSSANAFGLYGVLTATSPTAVAAAVRGSNASTNAHGYGVWGSQAGSGTGVYGYAPAGKGVYGASASGNGVRGFSTSGRGMAGFSNSGQGVYGHSNSQAGIVGESGSFDGVWGQAHSATYSGVSGHNDAGGYGVWGGTTGSGSGVYGTSPNGLGVEGASPNGLGVYGASSGGVGVDGASSSGYGVFGTSPSGYGVYGASPGGAAVVASSSSGYGVYGYSASGNHGAVAGQSAGGDAIRGISSATNFAGVYGENSTGATNAGYFAGHVQINGGCTGCAGPSLLQIDDPLDPAHKYLQHSSVASSQQLDLYSGNVRTNGKGFATVHMPNWFQALNRSFRYQLTSLSGLQQVAVAKEMQDNRFTIQSQKPHAKVSWQVSAVRHDRYANANPTRVIAAKPKVEQGKYVHPELYGKPRTDGIGYEKAQRPPRLQRRVVDTR
jgi:hypothetical protein